MHEEKITVLGKVVTACQVQYYGKMKSRLSFNVLVNQEIVKVVIFNRTFLKIHELDTLVTVTGTGSRTESDYGDGYKKLSKILYLKKLNPSTP